MEKHAAVAKEQAVEVEYALGHEPRELDRLTVQARLFAPVTRRLFEAAGVTRGMRVLDVGSGSGDVAFLARELVGASGEVIGLDRSSEAVATAAFRAGLRGYTNVRFIEGDIMDCALTPRVDAIVGRLVLMFQRDAAAAIRQLARSSLRAGGVMVFQEFDMYAARAVPPSPLVNRTMALIKQAFLATGASTEMGLKLPALFRAAGLPRPDCVAEGIVAAAGAEHALYGVIAEVVRSLLPVMERLGLASADDVEVDTLASRMSAEVAGLDGVLLSPTLVGAWTRTA